MSSGSSSSVLTWIKVIQRCGRKGQVVLKVPSEELDGSSDCT